MQKKTKKQISKKQVSNNTNPSKSKKTIEELEKDLAIAEKRSASAQKEYNDYVERQKERERKWIRDHRQNEIKQRDKRPLLKGMPNAFWKPDFCVSMDYKTEHLVYRTVREHSVDCLTPGVHLITDITEKILTHNIVYFEMPVEIYAKKITGCGYFNYAKVISTSASEITLLNEVKNMRFTLNKSDFTRLERVMGAFAFIRLDKHPGCLW